MLYWLTDDLVFPLVELAEDWGGLALGGDLSPERLLLAYRSGIFPWYDEDQPIIWHAPDPRFVLFPNKLHIPRSLRPVLNQKKFTITYNQAFREVIANCQQINRPDQPGTWITDEMLEAYCELHTLGHAHSVEAWQKGKLVGGLYGISLGKIFFGESMFSQVSNASKVAFVTHVLDLKQKNFLLIDCQVHTPHLQRFGAEEVPRQQYMKLLSKALSADEHGQ
ncbi:leucyl/phenylalanyl-tRNA--protein transferase [Tunicatimonas pelagia]|uniref:leucyl/phenylalanyl-tRNA--protein transferase n=1 Tax=Tunicatimonas pelagia TaxID=931531 RepID=UPI0026653A8B|nr:leucyl/phenylalanyl-tRNA--protein transferase [Tunicatimonas pelagia]WKN41185.1 leucyl/phenylalanyl-tRNA--protein transferase [Tunicatimonas pelagia]